MFKKNICAFLAAAAALISVPRVSASDGVFTVSSGTVDAGGDVTVDVSVRDGVKLTAVRLFVKYDATVFTLTDCEPVDFSDMTFGSKDYEPFTFLWLDGLSSGKASKGTFVRLTFSCDKDAPSGDYDFSLFYEEEDCIDINGYPLDFEIEEGTVTVTGGKPAETQKTVTTASSKETSGTSDKQTTQKPKNTDEKKTTTTKTETETQTSKTESSQKTTTAKSESEPDDSSETSTSAQTVTTAVSDEVSSAGKITTASAAAAASTDSSSQQDKQSDSKKGLIAVIAFIALCGTVFAVWLVFRIKKEK